MCLLREHQPCVITRSLTYSLSELLNTTLSKAFSPCTVSGNEHLPGQFTVQLKVLVPLFLNESTPPSLGRKSF